MNIRSILVALFLLLPLSACQSQAAAMEIICNASTGCADCNAADPSIRAARLAEYIANNVTNDEAVQMFSSIAAIAPADRARAIREAAAAEGITSCPIADVLGAPPTVAH